MKIRLFQYLAILSIALTACKQKLDKALLRPNPLFAEYIAAYSTGLVSKNASIQIKLQQRFDSLPDDCIRISPKIEGIYSLAEDRHTVVFKPKFQMKKGAIHTVSLEMDKFFPGIAKDLKKFRFQFQIIDQDFEVSSVGYYCNSASDFSNNTIKGEIYTADYVSSKELENLLVASQQNKKLDIKWQSSENNTKHTFNLAKVIRSNADDKVKLLFDGAAIGSDKEETKEIEIPSLDKFVVQGVEYISDKSNFVRILFSDPIMEQDLEGYIGFKDDQPKIKYSEINMNELKIYTESYTGESALFQILKGIRNIKNKPLSTLFEKELVITSNLPNIALLGEGNIIPKGEKLLFPFSAKGLKGVHLTVFKIYEKNIIQFFQQNNYDGTYQLKQVGKSVLEEDIMLKGGKANALNQTNNYYLDLSNFIQPEPGAIYRVQLSMRPYLSNNMCMKSDGLSRIEAKAEEDWENLDYYDYYEYEYDEAFYPSGYEWEERDNPCHLSFYTADKTVSRNVLASNFGIIAKLTNAKDVDVTVSNLLDANPISGVEILIFDYQQQQIGKGATNSDGFATIKPKGKPFFIMAKKNNEKGYLKITNGNALNLSNFDVGGEILKDGLNGFIYGERGVWRPGDDIYLTCVLQNNLQKFPENYPVKMTLLSPDQVIYDQQVNSQPTDGFYCFKFKTSPNAKTGNWQVKATAGAYTIQKNIKIETIKPNKLKINLAFNEPILSQKSGAGYLNVAWLHGAIAANLRTNITATIFAEKTTFDGYKKYIFDDVVKKFSTQEQLVFDNNLDANGNANFLINLKISNEASGKLKLGIFTKVFENGGEFSTRYETKEYSPYNVYIGMNINYGESESELLHTSKNNQINIVAIDDRGKPAEAENVVAKLFKLKNRWWFNANENESYLMSSNYSELITTQKINIVNGKGAYTVNVDENNWGKYYLKIEDENGGHSCGKVIWLDWPNWRNRGDMGEDVAIINFSADKEKYNIGDIAQIVIPSYKNGKALVSIENGSTIIEKRWVNTQAGQTKISIPITKEMRPNVYANITLIQPHNHTENTLPIRMFGIAPIFVEDKNSKLSPIIIAQEKIEPNSKYNITVSEKTGNEMTYTLAIVDEGLLDITSHKTPDIWTHFNKKVALGIRSWDMYNAVLGAFNGQISNIFAVGGSDAALMALNKANLNRFKPVVEFLGPFTINGGSKTHSLLMPNYVGSLKVMVIAGNTKNQYGMIEKNILVKKPLMLNTTLPRVLSPGETITMPITLFSDPKLSTANITISVNDLLLASTNKLAINLNKTNETLVYLPITVANKTGVAKIKITAKSANFTTFEEIEIPIRLPNPPTYQNQSFALSANQKQVIQYSPFGAEGTQNINLEVSTTPVLNLSERLGFLIQYPYGCIEQTTSAAFPQLYLTKTMDLEESKIAEIAYNIQTAITKLKDFQTTGGGLSYWPGSAAPDEWGTTYAGHFMLEANALGYKLPDGFIKSWTTYQQTKANQWQISNAENSQYYADYQLNQAYRLYTLALAKAENLGAMNRLREINNLSAATRWRLAAAYAILGKTTIAKELMNMNETAALPINIHQSQTYGSAERDLAMKLETYTLIKDQKLGFELVNRLSTILNGNNWLSTQTTAYCLIAINKFLAANSSSALVFDYEINGIKKQYNSQKNKQKLIKLPISKGTIFLNNKSQGTLFIKLSNMGTALSEPIAEKNDNLNMTIAYYNMANQLINPAILKQGTDFKAIITVTNPNTLGNYTNLAINHIIPSGWEIINLRLNDQASIHQGDIPTYQDIRDDRVNTFFNLNQNERKRFVLLLNASYKGNFYLPAIKCEAMYDGSVIAIKPNGRVLVE